MVIVQFSKSDEGKKPQDKCHLYSMPWEVCIGWKPCLMVKSKKSDANFPVKYLPIPLKEQINNCRAQYPWDKPWGSEMPSHSSNSEVQKKNLLSAVQLQPPKHTAPSVPFKAPCWSHTSLQWIHSLLRVFLKEDPSKPLFLIHLKSLFYCIWNPTLANLSAQWIIFQLISPTVRMCLPVAFFPLSRIYLAKCSPSSALPLSHRAVSSEHNFQQSSFTQPQIFRNRDESKAKRVMFTEYFYIWNSIHWLLFEPSPLKSPKWHLRAAEIKQSSKKGISCHGPGWLLCAGSAVTALLTAHLVCARDAVRSLQTSNEFSCQFCKARTIQ